MKLLHIDSSILGDNSVSRQLTKAVVRQWRQLHPSVEVSYRDLSRDAPGHLSAELLAAHTVAPEQRSAAQRDELVFSAELLREFLAADVIVLGAPMYNFSVPSQLKAWLDRIIVKDSTFKYATSGPVGLAGSKKVVIVSSRGGKYGKGSPAEAMDHQESYLKAALSFIGIRDFTVIRAEGVNMTELRDSAITSAHRQIQQMLMAA